MNLLFTFLFVILPLEKAFGMIGGRPAEPGEFPFIVSIEHFQTNKPLCMGLIVESDELVVPGDCILKNKDIGIGGGKVIPFILPKLKKSFTGIFQDTDLTNVWFSEWSLGNMVVLDHIIPLNKSTEDKDTAEYYPIDTVDSDYPVETPLLSSESDFPMLNQFSNLITVGSGWNVGAVQLLSKSDCAAKFRELAKKYSFATGDRPYCVVASAHEIQSGRKSRIPPGQPCVEDLGAPLIAIGTSESEQSEDHVVGVLAWASCKRGLPHIALYVKIDTEAVAGITKHFLNYQREAMAAVRPQGKPRQVDFDLMSKDVYLVHEAHEKEKYGVGPHHAGPLIVSAKRRPEESTMAGPTTDPGNLRMSKKGCEDGSDNIDSCTPSGLTQSVSGSMSSTELAGAILQEIEGLDYKLTAKMLKKQK